MDNVKKIIIGTLIIGTIGAGLVISGEVVNLNIGSDSVWVTKSQYGEIKTEIIAKFLTEGQLTWQELQLLTAVLNVEAKKGRFENIKNVNEENIIEKMIKNIP